MVNKKGLSEAITWIIGIALVLVVVGIVWVVLQGITTQAGENVEGRAACLEINLKVDSVECGDELKSCTGGPAQKGTCAQGQLCSAATGGTCKIGSVNVTTGNKQLDSIKVSRTSGGPEFDKINLLITSNGDRIIETIDGNLKELEARTFTSGDLSIKYTEVESIEIGAVIIKEDGSELPCPPTEKQVTPQCHN